MMNQLEVSFYRAGAYRGARQDGWYLATRGDKIAAGPFASEAEAEAALQRLQLQPAEATP